MRALLIKMSSLGDVIHALPAVTDACAQGVTFDWVVEEAFADIPAAHPGVDQVIPIAWRRWRKNLWHERAALGDFYQSLRQTSYDMVIDSQGLIKSALVASLARGPKQGFSHTVAREPWAAFAYGRGGHRVARGQHAIDRQRQLFAQAFGYELPAEESSGLDANRPQPSKRVYLLHGTTWVTKHWPVAMWQELASLIQQAGFEPVLTWGDDAERERAQAISQTSGAEIVDRMPLASLQQAMAEAAIVIGVDSGLCHLSAALGTPTLGLYGPTDGVLTGARGRRAAYMHSDLSCAPCLQASCKNYSGEPLKWQNQLIEPACFAELTPQRVWHAAQQLMGDQHGG